MNIARRVAPLFVLALFAIVGCSSDTTTERLLATANPFDRREQAPSPVFLAAFQAGAPRYIAAIESKPDAISVFVRQTLSDTSGVGTWIGPDASQLLFDNGFLVGSRGFGNDVMASDVGQTKALVQSLRPGFSTRLMTLITGEDRAVTRAFKCKVTIGEIDSVVVGTQPVAARTATENCRGEVASFLNFYWVVPGSGEIIQSSQWAGTGTGKISFRTTPADAG